MSRLLVRPAGQVVAAAAARLLPDIVAGIARTTRIPGDCIRCARDVPLLPMTAALPVTPVPARYVALPARRRDPE
jgi:hypothetical protein